MIQNRRLGTGLSTHLLTRIATALIRKAIVIFGIFTVFARGLTVHRLTLYLLQRTFKIFISYAEGRKSARRRRFGLLQNGKHQMFGTNVLVAFFLGNLSRIKKSGFAASRKRKQCTMGIAHSHNATVRRKGTLNVFAQLIQIDFKGAQSFGGKAGIFANKAEQQVFSRYAVAT